MDVHRALLLSLPLLLAAGGLELANRDFRSDTSPTLYEVKTTAQPRRMSSKTPSTKRRALALTSSGRVADGRAVNAVALLGLGLASLGAPAR
jgi:hypothetical protein